VGVASSTGAYVSRLYVAPPSFVTLDSRRVAMTSTGGRGAASGQCSGTRSAVAGGATQAAHHRGLRGSTGCGRRGRVPAHRGTPPASLLPEAESRGFSLTFEWCHGVLWVMVCAPEACWGRQTGRARRMTVWRVNDVDGSAQCWEQSGSANTHPPPLLGLVAERGCTNTPSSRASHPVSLTAPFFFCRVRAGVGRHGAW
jgi:hypothetical protein